MCVNTTPHTSHFLNDLHAHAWLKSCVCRAHIMCHESSPCAHVFVHHVLSYHPVLLPAHQHHLPRCGGQIPCALSLMRTLAPLPSTTSHRFSQADKLHHWQVGQGCHVLSVFGVVRLVVLVKVVVESASGFESGRTTWHGRMNAFMWHNAKRIAASVLSQMAR